MLIFKLSIPNSVVVCHGHCSVVVAIVVVALVVVECGQVGGGAAEGYNARGVHVTSTVRSSAFFAVTSTPYARVVAQTPLNIVVIILDTTIKTLLIFHSGLVFGQMGRRQVG